MYPNNNYEKLFNTCGHNAYTEYRTYDDYRRTKLTIATARKHRRHSPVDKHERSHSTPSIRSIFTSFPSLAMRATCCAVYRTNGCVEATPPPPHTATSLFGGLHQSASTAIPSRAFSVDRGGLKTVGACGSCFGASRFTLTLRSKSVQIISVETETA